MAIESILMHYYTGGFEYQLRKFEYDNNPNIFSSLSYYHPEESYTNNLVREYTPAGSIFDEFGEIIETFEEKTIKEYYYTYNELGYPITRSLKNNSLYLDIIEY